MGAKVAHRLYPRAAPNMGACTNPNIEFGVGFDGHKEASYRPVDRKQFNHGAADIITVVSFICDRIRDSCRAPQAAQDLCAVAKAAINGLAGKAAVDAWNKAFPAVGGKGAGVAG